MKHLTLKKNLFLIVSALLVLVAASALADVSIDTKTFPDDAFRSYVSGTFDKDGNGKLDAGEIRAANRIDIAASDISSLKGVETLSALTVLHCGGNKLTELDVSHNTQLEELACGGNQLTSLDVSKNGKLRELDFNNNQLTSIDVSGNPSLRELDCSSNKLSALDVRKNAQLQILSCYDNRLTALDVSENKQLQSLFCDGNKFKKLDVSKCPALLNLIKTTTPDVHDTYGYGWWTDDGSETLDWYGPNLFVNKNVQVITDAESIDDIPLSEVTSEGVTYHFNKDGTATVTKAEKDLTKAVIPATLKANGKTYKVTAIADKAFKGVNGLTALTIGKNVKKIGRKAFYHCKKLVSITISTGSLDQNSIGADAFNGVPKTAKIKVPKKKVELYKTILVKAGVNRKAKITK